MSSIIHNWEPNDLDLEDTIRILIRQRKEYRDLCDCILTTLLSIKQTLPHNKSHIPEIEEWRKRYEVISRLGE